VADRTGLRLIDILALGGGMVTAHLLSGRGFSHHPGWLRRGWYQTVVEDGRGCGGVA